MQPEIGTDINDFQVPLEQGCCKFIGQTMGQSQKSDIRFAGDIIDIGFAEG
jgi:hypothetical protein